jgi:hypothetical protein
LIVRRGTSLEADIAVHLDVDRVPSHRLAGFAAKQKTVFLLRPEGESAYEVCATYVGEYHKAVPGKCSNVHVVTVMHDERTDKAHADKNVAIILFDPGLTQDEMDSYITFRMIDRHGPGSTDLVRAIIREFAGFDVELAERLMQFDDDQILDIRSHLGKIVAEDTDRWRRSSWDQAACSHRSPENHLLTDQYLFENGTDAQRKKAEASLKRRYWRACLKALTPWLEERKGEVLSYFTKSLEQLAAATDGYLVREHSGGRGPIRTHISELEFNDIVGLVKSDRLAIEGARQDLAYRTCRLAKFVRDPIAHMRDPDVPTITKLISAMDKLLGGDHSG